MRGAEKSLLRVSLPRRTHKFIEADEIYRYIAGEYYERGNVIADHIILLYGARTPINQRSDDRSIKQK